MQPRKDQLQQHKERVADKLQGLVTTVLSIPAAIQGESSKQVCNSALWWSPEQNQYQLELSMVFADSRGRERAVISAGGPHQDPPGMCVASRHAAHILAANPTPCIHPAWLLLHDADNAVSHHRPCAEPSERPGSSVCVRCYPR
jgi:hypothetical protein